MRYLCCVFHEEKQLEALAKYERRAFERVHLDDEEIKKNGAIRVAPSRQRAWATSRCVRFATSPAAAS